jgi:hypothetical protein
MGRKKMTPEEWERMMAILQIPPGSALPERLMEIIEYTKLPYLALLEKWLHQEEASIEAAKRTEEEISKRVEERVAILERKVFRLENKDMRWESPSRAQYKQMLVFQVLSLRKAGKTYKQIAELFNEEKAPTISGRRRWSPSMAINLLGNNKGESA